MSAKIISGKDVSAEIREELKGRAARLKERGVVPGLAVVLVGRRPGGTSFITETSRSP